MPPTSKEGKIQLQNNDNLTHLCRRSGPRVNYPIPSISLTNVNDDSAAGMVMICKADIMLDTCFDATDGREDRKRARRGKYKVKSMIPLPRGCCQDNT